MRIGRRFTFYLAFFVLLIPTLTPLAASAAEPEIWQYTIVPTNPPNPGSDWGAVTQLLTDSGCNGTNCGSSWRPNNGTFTILLENRGDRVALGHGSGDGSPPYSATV